MAVLPILNHGTANSTNTNTSGCFVLVITLLSRMLQGTTGFRLEVFADESLPYGGPGRHTANGNFVLTELVVNEQGNNAHVPTPGAWGLALMALLLSMAGIFRLRKNANSIQETLTARGNQ